MTIEKLEPVNVIEPPPGIYWDVPFDEYCHWDAINNSSLGPVLRSAKHYLHAQESVGIDSDALSFGRLCHEGRLEPAAVLDRYAVMPDLTEGIESERPRSTKEYRERVAKWKEQHRDRIVLSQDDFDRMTGVLNACWSNQRCREWFASPGPAEVSIVWRDQISGLLCKARLDKLVHEHAIADLKTTSDAAEFERSIEKYSYDRQAAFYLDGYRTITGFSATFNFAAVESHAPFGVRAAPLSWQAVASGRRKYRMALERIAEMRRTGTVSDYQQPDVFELPRWAASHVALYYQGQRIWDLYEHQ